MRICLYWNPKAGDGAPLDEITRAIGRAGHDVAGVLHHKDDVKAALEMEIDALVVAGGDGTVARAGRALAGGALPIAILPLGTANNIATSLGIADDPMAAIENWRKQKVVRMDVGVVNNGERERLFIEGVGTGLLPAGISRGRNDHKPHTDASGELEWARDVFLEAVDELQLQPSRLRIDDEEVAGEYLLVEVLNIASVGPRLRLSAETAPADGLLSVVIAGDADREAIRQHLHEPTDETDSHAWLKSWRARRVEVAGWHEYHVDDKVCASATGKLTITIRPEHLAVLA